MPTVRSAAIHHVAEANSASTRDVRGDSPVLREQVMSLESRRANSYRSLMASLGVVAALMMPACGGGDGDASGNPPNAEPSGCPTRVPRPLGISRVQGVLAAHGFSVEVVEELKFCTPG